MTDVSDEHRQASLDLVEATRRLMLAASTTEADPTLMAQARARLDEVTALLEVQTRDRVMRTPFLGTARSADGGAGQPWTIFPHNPQGIPITIEFDGDRAWARLVGTALHEGPRDCLHGGFSAQLMDCVLGTLIQAQGRLSVTATLDVRYLHPTPLDRALELHGRIVDVSGRKIMAEGWIEHDGIRTVEATGLFIDIDTSRPMER